METPSLYLKTEYDRFSVFFPLLQKGFALNIKGDFSIRRLLCNHIGLSPEYLENRIQTIFLDCRPVDETDQTTIRPGSTLALSAAMPGLVGSTLKRGSHLAAFRNSITHHQEDGIPPDREGIVVLKLFNLLVRELGPLFLEKGILIKQEELTSLLNTQPDDFWAGCEAVIKDGAAVSEMPPDLAWPDHGPGFVMFRMERK